MDDERLKQMLDVIARGVKLYPDAHANSAPYTFHIEYTVIQQLVVVDEGTGGTIQNRPSSPVAASIQFPFTKETGGHTMTDFPGFGNNDALAMWIVSQITYYAIQAAGTIKDKIVDKAADAVVDGLTDRTRRLWKWIKDRLGTGKPTQKMLEQFEQDPKKHLRDVASEVRKGLEFDDDFRQAFLKEVGPLIKEIVDLKAELAVKQTTYAPQITIASGPGAKAQNLQGNGNTQIC